MADITRLTKRLPKKHLKLLKFIFKYIPLSILNRADIYFKDNDNIKGLVGWAYPDYRIVLEFGKPIKYPNLQTYRKRAGPVYVRDFDADFVYYMAHEFRHLMQFSGHVEVRHPEVDAELFAQEVLKDYYQDGLSRLRKKHKSKK